MKKLFIATLTTILGVGLFSIKVINSDLSTIKITNVIQVPCKCEKNKVKDADVIIKNLLAKKTQNVISKYTYKELKTNSEEIIREMEKEFNSIGLDSIEIK